MRMILMALIAAVLALSMPAAANAQSSFYTPPPSLPDKPGTLLKTQPYPHVLQTFGPEVAGSAEKILYTSSTVHGAPVAVSGYVLEPAHPTRIDGVVPTIVIGPGTRGGGDICATPRSDHMVGAFNPQTLDVNINYELPMIYAAAHRGYRVIVTDYIGLGTPGPHTYVLHTEEGNAVLDAARAGLEAAGAPADTPLAFWGFSQGGGAVAAAAERHPVYAPELNLKATYAGAPPADLTAVMKQVDGHGIFGVLGYAMKGFAARYPEIDAELNRILNNRGHNFVDYNSDRCIVNSALNWGLRDSRELTNDSRRLSEVISDNETIMALFDEQNLGNRTPTTPILLGTGHADDALPDWQVRKLARTYCQSGAHVRFLSTDLPTLTSSVPLGADHAVGMFVDFQTSLSFLEAAIKGAPLPGNCARV